MGSRADDDEGHLFEEEMRDVRRLKREADGAPVEKVLPAPVVRAPAQVAADAHTFEIELSGERVAIFHPSLPPASRKALRRGATRPERTLDLHGTKAADAERRVERLVAESQHAGLRCLLVITGRGLRSGANGPVLRARVVQQLTGGPLASRVLAVVSAPVNLGDTGALLVLLRKATRRATSIRA